MLSTMQPGLAISDYYFHRNPASLWVYDMHGPRVEMHVPTYFRAWKEMPELEQIAITECKGRVLDIGAGAGSHALELQHRKRDVTSLDISPEAVEVMKHRGVEKAIVADIFQFSDSKFDTLLLLMNGIGLAGTLPNLHLLLQHFKTLLNPGGKILFDSSDVSYLFNKNNPKPADYYFGEITCRYGYKKKLGDWFKWLYVDFETLKEIATAAGFITTLLMDDGNDQYLVRLVC